MEEEKNKDLQTKEDSSRGKDNPAVVHTFQSDASNFVKSRGITSADVLAAETKRSKNDDHFYDSHNFSETGKKQKNNIRLIAFLSLGLIFVLSAVVAYLVFSPKENQTEIIIRETKPFILPDRVIQSSLEDVLHTVGINGQVNTLLYIPIMKAEGLEKKHISSRDFLENLTPRPPESFLEGLETPFMLSEFYFSRNTPILVFKVGARSRAVAGMISWEKNINLSLENFFGKIPGGNFKDIVIEGHDSRGILDSQGKPVLFYSFVEDGSYLVITKSEEGFKEIIRRFNYPQYRNI